MNYKGSSFSITNNNLLKTIYYKYYSNWYAVYQNIKMNTNIIIITP